MNKKIISDLENMIRIQRDCLSGGEYMRGMLNGIICAHSVVADTDPHYENPKPRRKTKIRHKIKNEKY